MRQLVVALMAAGGMLVNGAAREAAAETVDLELVLLADASRSIDNAEIRFQRQGYASAITHPEVLGAIAQGFEQRIAVTYVEWGDASSQEVVVPWTVVDGPESAAAFAAALLEAPRRAHGPNAIGNALAVGCAVSWSFTLIGYRWISAHATSPAAAAVLGNLIAGVAALALGLPFEAGRASDWAAVAYLGVVQLALPYVFLSYAVPRLGALEVSLLLLVEPVLNPVWAWLVHGETPSGWALVGGLLILGATVVRVVASRGMGSGTSDDRTA